MNASRFASAFVLLFVSAGGASGQGTTRASVDSAGAEANRDCNVPAISSDGQIVAFQSWATNLVPGDTNQFGDVFVHDRAAGTTERVSVDSSGGEANDYSGVSSLSSDGRWVAFESLASNLVAGDGNGRWDIFVHDRSTGVTERVSVSSAGAEGNESSYQPSISANGQFVAFVSLASNFVPGDDHGFDVFVHDRATGVTERVSVDSLGAPANGLSLDPAISGDGQVVAFYSFASNLVAGDTNGSADVFVHDRSTGTTERVSVDSSGAEGNLGSTNAALSQDGQVVTFASFASNLVAVDTNGMEDIFVHDRATGFTERVSLDSAGAEPDDASGFPTISGDGRAVVFSSLATNLVPNDANLTEDVFVHDRSTGSTERVSVDSSGGEANANSFAAMLAADGGAVVFDSLAWNLVPNDTNGSFDVFAHDLCLVHAAWSNYGAGFPGTNGVPVFTSQQNPVLGATITLDLFNSYANPTAGLVFVGFQRTSLHSNWGGDLLVVPALTLLVTFSYGGDSFTGTIPDDSSLCGFTIDLQAIEADPGAAKGVSFTPGLELVLGR